MAARLDARAEQRERSRIWACEKPCRECRRRTGPRRCDRGAIEKSVRLTAIGIERDDHGLVGRQLRTIVARKERHELRHQRAGRGKVRRHRTEDCVALVDPG
jgi:hypothetical protein